MHKFIRSLLRQITDVGDCGEPVWFVHMCLYSCAVPCAFPEILGKEYISASYLVASICGLCVQEININNFEKKNRRGMMIPLLRWLISVAF